MPLENLITMMPMYYFKTECDLLLKIYEIYCDLFIIGIMDYNDFEILETDYLKRKELFTINLN